MNEQNEKELMIVEYIKSIKTLPTNQNAPDQSKHSRPIKTLSANQNSRLAALDQSYI